MATGKPVTVSPEMERVVPSDLREYYLAFLVNPPERREMSDELFVAHQAYIRKQVENGHFKLVGPVTDGGRMRGMKIVAAESLDQARELAEGDPAVREGIFLVEVHPVILPSLENLKIRYADSD